jgi:hypothetical protein
VKKKDGPKPKDKGKKKEEVKEMEKREEKIPFLHHVENGRKYNLGKPLRWRSRIRLVRSPRMNLSLRCL